jgi:hypothetical protein
MLNQLRDDAIMRSRRMVGEQTLIAGLGGVLPNASTLLLESHSLRQLGLQRN